MARILNDFKKIPHNIYARTKSFISEHIAILQPEEYVSGLKVINEDYHFIILQSTCPLFRVGKKEYQFKKGTLMAIQPDTELATLPSSSTLPGKYISITIRKDFFDKTILTIIEKEKADFIKIENTYSWNLIDTVEKLKQEINNYGEKYPVMIQSLSTQFIFELLRDINGREEIQNFKKNGDKIYINRIVEYMHSYYNGNITIKDISCTFHISPGHLQRLFKLHTGQSPHQYLLGIRLQKAEDLLKRNNYSIAEIAELCGFVSQGHFSTVFRQNVGTSPLKYRKVVKTL